MRTKDRVMRVMMRVSVPALTWGNPNNHVIKCNNGNSYLISII